MKIGVTDMVCYDARLIEYYCTWEFPPVNSNADRSGQQAQSCLLIYGLIGMALHLHLTAVEL
jgi:hypothetical protein